mgnify:CR=1 FL=1
MLQLNNPYWFLERLWISDKKGKLVRLILNQEQRQVIAELEEGNNLVIAKARQLGISTIVTAYLFWKIYIAIDPISAVSILHKQDSANEIFLKYETFHNNMPLVLQKTLAKKTASTLRYTTGSSVSATTAGGHGGLRSYTLNIAHISELCFYQDPDELLSTVLSALNGNQIIIESTAKMYGDPMHLLIDKIQRGELQGKWKLLFFPWHEHKEYAFPVDNSFSPTTEEISLAEMYDLTKEQLYWRRLKIQEMGISKFKTEYPACLEDIFSQKGDAYYTDTDLEHVTPFLLPANQELTYIEQPNPMKRYAIGVDVASGAGKDYSVIMVLEKMTNNPVCIFRSNEITPVNLARKIQHISAEYNNAKALIESNNWGLPVLNELRNLGFINLWHDQLGNDWTTTSKSKLVLHEELKEALRCGVISELDTITISELRELALNKNGLAPESVRGKSGHSDQVIALGLAFQCLKTIERPLSAAEKFFQQTKTRATMKRTNLHSTVLPRGY